MALQPNLYSWVNPVTSLGKCNQRQHRNWQRVAIHEVCSTLHAFCRNMIWDGIRRGERRRAFFFFGLLAEVTKKLQSICVMGCLPYASETQLNQTQHVFQHIIRFYRDANLMDYLSVKVLVPECHLWANFPRLITMRDPIRAVTTK